MRNRVRECACASVVYRSCTAAAAHVHAVERSDEPSAKNIDRKGAYATTKRRMGFGYKHVCAWTKVKVLCIVVCGLRVQQQKGYNYHNQVQGSGRRIIKQEQRARLLRHYVALRTSLSGRRS